VLLQPRLEVELADWLLRGDLDLVRVDRQADGTLLVLIGELRIPAPNLFDFTSASVPTSRRARRGGEPKATSTWG
jgi:hypothetical protein